MDNRPFRIQLEIVGLQVGMPRTHGHADAVAPMDREWTSGFFKEPVEGPLWVTHTGITGDGQADLIHHGGPDKALNVYPWEHYAGWSSELGLELPAAAFGENLTTRGLTEEAVCVGDVFGLGDLRLQITQPRQPCWKLSRRWRIRDLAARVERTGRTGWYFRVLTEGSIQSGTLLDLIERPHPDWSITAANEVMHQQKGGDVRALELAGIDALSASWKVSLTRRVAGGSVDRNERLQGPGHEAG
ncbi:MAG TPA: MOSC domain-containing protein [Verrucomicrobiales bacterium]|nr:MOSC domain-containing protein [Verrucomicrobiales bacterium]